MLLAMKSIPIKIRCFRGPQPCWYRPDCLEWVRKKGLIYDNAVLWHAHF